MNRNFVWLHEIFNNKMLKISAFYLDKQKSFVPKKSMWHVSNRD